MVGDLGLGHGYLVDLVGSMGSPHMLAELYEQEFARPGSLY